MKVKLAIILIFVLLCSLYFADSISADTALTELYLSDFYDSDGMEFRVPNLSFGDSKKEVLEHFGIEEQALEAECSFCNPSNLLADPSGYFEIHAEANDCASPIFCNSPPNAFGQDRVTLKKPVLFEDNEVIYTLLFEDNRLVGAVYTMRYKYTPFGNSREEFIAALREKFSSLCSELSESSRNSIDVEYGKNYCYIKSVESKYAVIAMHTYEQGIYSRDSYVEFTIYEDLEPNGAAFKYIEHIS